MLVHAASGVIVSAWVRNRSTPSTEISRSSPRAAKICSFSRWYRGFSESDSGPASFSSSVGRMPIMTRCAPIPAACSSAWLSASRISCSQESGPPPALSRRGARLISRLNRPSSVDQEGSAIASRTSMLRMAGSPAGVHEVQFDLQTDLRPLEVEPRLPQHPGEHVEAGVHLVPEPAAVFTGELQRRNVTSHRSLPSSSARTPTLQRPTPGAAQPPKRTGSAREERVGPRGPGKPPVRVSARA